MASAQSEMKGETRRILDSVAQKFVEADRLTKSLKELELENRQLKARIAELEKQLGTEKGEEKVEKTSSPTTAAAAPPTRDSRPSSILLIGGQMTPPVEYLVEAAELHQWSQPLLLKACEGHVVACGTDGKVIVVGGQLHEKFEKIDHVCSDSGDSVMLYEPAKGSRLVQPMNEKRYKADGAFIGNRFYVFGGVQGPNERCHAGEAYDFETDSWQFVRPPPVAKLNYPLVVGCGAWGALVICCMFDPLAPQRLSREEASVTLRYDAVADSWQRLATMNEVRREADAVFHRGKVIVAGGRTDSYVGRVLETAEAYDIATNKWEAFPPLPDEMTTSCTHRMVSYKERLFLFDSKKDGYQHFRWSSLIYEFNWDKKIWNLISTGTIPTETLQNFRAIVYYK